jgi:hypothetical protein
MVSGGTIHGDRPPSVFRAIAARLEHRIAALTRLQTTLAIRRISHVKLTHTIITLSALRDKFMRK